MTDKLIVQLTSITGNSGLLIADVIYVQRPGTPNLDFKLSGQDILDFIANNYQNPNNVVIRKQNPGINFFDQDSNGTNFSMYADAGQLFIGDTDGSGNSTHTSLEINPSAQTLWLKSSNSTLGGNIIATTNMFATVATSGAYADLTGKPSLATVATSGAYADLTGNPTVGTAAFVNIAVSGQSTVTATTLTDTTTFVAGANMTITTSGKNITFAAASSIGSTAASTSVVASGFTKMSTSDTNAQTAFADIDTILAGYGTIATQSASSVAITGGTLTGVTVTGLHNGLRANNNSTFNTILDFTSTLTANRTLSIVTGDANASLTLSGTTSLSGTNTGDQTITLTGDVTGSGTGSFATTIGNNVVTYAKFQQVAAVSLVGNATGSLANATGITIGASLAFVGSALQTIAMTGDITTSANSFVTSLGANVVTNAKMRQAAGLSVIGNSTSSTANVADITASSSGQVLTYNGTTLGFGAVNLASTNAVTGILAGANGGTGSQYVTFSGPTASRTYTLPDATDSIACLGQVNAYTAQQYFTQATLTDASSISWNLNTQQCAIVTLGGNRTLANPTNMKAGATYSLIVKQDGTGSRTLAYGANYFWPSGTAPTLTTAANSIDILTFISDGTYMYGTSAQNFLV